MPSLPTAALLANLAATWFMVGLIWFVQLVHYPLFAGVGGDGWADYHRAHARRVTWVVAPVMAVELATAIALVARRPPGVPAWAAWVSLAAAGLIWLSTALVQVPAHGRLAAGFDPATARSLVAGNWPRTALWTLRGLLVAGMMALAA